mmetsp:Transcript_20959/g.43521  ORF Transcript_20959/g.43521 Transcript_20959/m.43521 type:complete len:156 (-) Transcript_20959:115-582(-)
MQPWVEDFKWRVIDWHYNFYMGPKARGAVMSNQKGVRQLQEVFDKRSHGFTTRLAEPASSSAPYSPQRTKYFAWTTCIPQVAPYKRNSNPFCKVSPNVTGWREYVEQKDVRGAARPKTPDVPPHRVQHILNPKPKGSKHVVAGTNDEVPTFPKQD